MDAKIENQSIKDNSTNEEQKRFRVETVKPNGEIVTRERTDDADKAMRAYIKLSKDDFGKEHGAGSYVALTDNELKLDAARVAEGKGTYKVQFGKEEGRIAFEETEKTMKSEATLERATPQVVQEDKDAQTEKSGARTPVEEMSIDPAALERVAVARSRDTTQAREALGLNTLEPDIEKQQQQLAGEEEGKRSAWLKKAEDAKAAQPTTVEKTASDNKVESDEIFTATQRDVKPVVPPEVEKQYLRVGDKFYHSKNTDMVAFEDKGNKLETKSNSENIAESMVRIAEARGWDEIKVSGSETFRKEVWLEAASRGMHVKGYSPSEQDKAELGKRVSESEANKIEKDNKPFRAREKEAEETKDSKPEAVKPEVSKTDSPGKRMAETFANESALDAVKKHPELAGAAAAVAVMDKKAEADGLTPAQRAIVSARVRQNVVNSIERGDIPQVTVKEDVEVKRDAKEDKEYAR